MRIAFRAGSEEEKQRKNAHTYAKNAQNKCFKAIQLTKKRTAMAVLFFCYLTLQLRLFPEFQRNSPDSLWRRS